MTMTMTDETRLLGSFETAPAPQYEVEIDGARYQALAYADLEIGQLPALAESAQALADIGDSGLPPADAMSEVHQHMRTLLSAQIPDLPADVLDRLTPRLAVEIAQILSGLE